MGTCTFGKRAPLSLQRPGVKRGWDLKIVYCEGDDSTYHAAECILCSWFPEVGVGF